MFRKILFSTCIIGLTGICVALTVQNKLKEMVKDIHWLGQATIMINAPGTKIYIDPYQLKKTDKADLILITHSHYDHFSPDDLQKIATKNTVIIAPEECIYKAVCASRITLKPGEEYKYNDSITISAVPAYNIVKANKHPKNNNWIGYILNINGIKIYHAGDTERIPEMKTFTCDIAMLPLGQTYTMNTVADAAAAAVDVKAKIAIPIHYGLYEGKDSDAEEFRKMLINQVDVIIKHRE